MCPFFKCKVLYVLTTHFDCFSSQVNNLEDVEKKNIFFIDIKQYFGKIKRLVISRKGNL